uniref:Alternative protein ABTB1 n=1 Tax=Homo sapiens TaxID=9606 RepID=L8E906_HUMAN|nr:alternative protein ABTB1 [Homo sapiens]
MSLETPGEDPFGMSPLPPMHKPAPKTLGVDTTQGNLGWGWALVLALSFSRSPLPTPVPNPVLWPLPSPELLL